MEDLYPKVFQSFSEVLKYIYAENCLPFLSKYKRFEWQKTCLFSSMQQFSLALELMTQNTATAGRSKREKYLGRQIALKPVRFIVLM